MYFFGFSNLLVLGVKKIEKLQQAASQRAEDIFKMRLGELRRLPTKQNGGSGLPKELPRLSPKVTMDIGGTSFGRLGDAVIQIRRQHGLQNRSKLEVVCWAKSIAKPMLFLGFGLFFWFWRIGKSSNCSKRLLNELKTRSK